MQLSIVGCPEKKLFRPYVKRAALFYAESLLTKKVLENIYLQVKFTKDIPVYGYAEITDYNVSGKPREFEIEIHSGIGAAEILKTLAHEMVHIKQYVYGETNDQLSRWKGTKVDSDNLEYWVQPWEIEAHGMEVGLFSRFAIKEKLWEVFKGIQDPDGPIVQEPLGWKTPEVEQT